MKVKIRKRYSIQLRSTSLPFFIRWWNMHIENYGRVYLGDVKDILLIDGSTFKDMMFYYDKCINSGNFKLIGIDSDGIAKFKFITPHLKKEE